MESFHPIPEIRHTQTHEEENRQSGIGKTWKNVDKKCSQQRQTFPTASGNIWSPKFIDSL